MTTETANPSGAFWRSLPWLLLGTALSGWAYMAYLAVHDPNFAIEPDYYAKGVAWDRQMAEERASERLGWSAQLAVGAESDRGFDVVVELRDRQGNALERALVTADSFAIAHSAVHARPVFVERTAGTYVGHVERDWPGLWEIRLRAERGADHFRKVVRLERGPRPARSLEP